MKFKNIVKGWWNYFFRKPEIEGTAKERLEICNKCIHKKYSFWKFSYVCGFCGCPLQKKVRCSEEECEILKWPEVKKEN